MSNFISPYASGRWIGWLECPLTVAGVGPDQINARLFKSSGTTADANLKTYATLADALTGGMVECTFTNYPAGGKVYVASDFTITVNSPSAGITTAAFNTDPAFLTAGGASNDAVGRLGLFYRPSSGAANSAHRCIGWFDQTGSTNGTTYTCDFPSTGIGTAKNF